MLEQPSNHPVTYECVKVHKRLWLREVETGKLVYTPPEWVRVRLPSRKPMEDLARQMTSGWGECLGLRYDIRLITAFETKYNPRMKT